MKWVILISLIRLGVLCNRTCVFLVEMGMSGFYAMLCFGFKLVENSKFSTVNKLFGVVGSWNFYGSEFPVAQKNSPFFSFLGIYHFSE